MIYGWSPGIGDPSFLGWFTVFAYAATSILCVAAARNGRAARRFWRVLAIALAFLAINKQLDLQSLLTAIGRKLANSEGWYEQRREVQRLFVGAIMLFGLTSVPIAVFKFRNKSLHVRAAAAGFVVLGAFICVRAASFHHVDRFLNAGIFGARFNWIIEIGGILLIASNAFGAWQARAGKTRPGPSLK